MVVYYSYGGSTRIYAEILAELLGDEIFELREKSPRTGFFGKISGAFEAIIGVSGPLVSLPDMPVGKAVFMCSPIWAGTYPPAVSEFLKKSSLRQRKVNVILTCGNILKRDAYKKKTLRTLRPLGCIIGFVRVFVCDPKLAPDRVTVRKHLKKLVLNVDEAF